MTIRSVQVRTTTVTYFKLCLIFGNIKIFRRACMKYLYIKQEFALFSHSWIYKSKHEESF